MSFLFWKMNAKRQIDAGFPRPGRLSADKLHILAHIKQSWSNRREIFLPPESCGTMALQQSILKKAPLF